VIEPRTSIETRSLDAITQAGPYALGMTKGHQMEISRKGGAYQFDAWVRIAPPSIEVYNPAFDVTPAELVTAIITERGIARAPYAMRTSRRPWFRERDAGHVRRGAEDVAARAAGKVDLAFLEAGVAVFGGPNPDTTDHG